MKHVKVLSTEKPAQADEVAWIQLKDIIGGNQPPGKAFGGNLIPGQAGWMMARFDQWMQK